MTTAKEIAAQIEKAIENDAHRVSVSSWRRWTEELATSDNIRILLSALSEAEQHVEILQNKIDGEKSCACAYDYPDDICAVHSPKLAKAEAERYALAMAICGGEDAPGYLDSVSVEEIVAVHKQNCQWQIDRAERAEADLRDAALATHRQASCLHQCAALIGPDTVSTVAGLPKAVKHLVALAERAEAALAQAREALGDIAKQPLTSEYPPEKVGGLDFEGGYDTCVQVARNALAERAEASLAQARKALGKPVAWTSAAQLERAVSNPGDNLIMWGEPLPYHGDIPLYALITDTGRTEGEQK